MWQIIEVKSKAWQIIKSICVHFSSTKKCVHLSFGGHWHQSSNPFILGHVSNYREAYVRTSIPLFAIYSRNWRPHLVAWDVMHGSLQIG
jgi:hypothetical protein